MTSYPARLLLIRHGETDWNRLQIPQGHIDVPLNHEGCAQAHALAKRLRDWEVHAIYTSDLSRAAETAAILGRTLGLVPIPAASWREIDLGGWGGLPDAELKVRFGDELAAVARGEDIQRGGGETMAEVQVRAVEAFEEIRRTHPQQTVALVSHGGTLKALICHLIGLELSRVGRLSTRGNAGLSIIEFDQGRPRLVLLNDTSHVDGTE
jgi:broad specificity phosphatase PhoE